MLKKSKNNLLLNALVMLLLFSSCSLKEIKLEAPQVNNLILENRYRINLPEDHSNGYLWRLSENYDKNVIINLNRVWRGNKKGVDFNFNTLSKGQTTLTLILRKQNDTADIKHFVVDINDK